MKTHRISLLVATTLMSPRAHTAGIRLAMAGIVHRFEVDVEKGRFVRLEGFVETILENRFSYVLDGMTAGQQREFRDIVCWLIRDRHESQLPRLEPRRLPLSLPALGPKPLLCGARKNKAQREKAQREKATV
jgi:hypothetical protein